MRPPLLNSILKPDKVAEWIDVYKDYDEPNHPSSHPGAMVLNQKEDVLYVALANADYVAALDLRDNVSAPNRLFRVYGARDRNPRQSSGAVPVAVALSPDGKYLYAALAAVNAVAVFDLTGEAEDRNPMELIPRKPDPFLGMIPTEWYPSALAIAGNDLLIITAKGEGSGPNNMQNTLQGERKRKEYPYIPTLIGGSIQRLSLADIDKNLASYTQQVEQDNLLRSDGGVLAFANGTNSIRHVIYILKENRTYDQIFGDLPAGDGDPSLTMYGKDVTPNEHKLALQFGVLDNFYDSGEVSGDGHLWSTASTTSDYNEKSWPIAYRGKERTYDFGGSVADEIPLEQGIPDVDDPGTGFLWDNLARSGLTYRIYGEFIAAVWCRNEKAQSPVEGTPPASSASCPVAVINKGEPLPAKHWQSARWSESVAMGDSSIQAHASDQGRAT